MSNTTQETEHEGFDARVRGLVGDLEALVAIANGYGDDLTEDDWQVLEGFGITNHDQLADDVRETVREQLDEWPLAMTEHGTRSPGGEWETSHYVILFGTGGPHIELDGSTGRLEGYWWGDRVSVSIDDAVLDYYTSSFE